MSNYHIVYTPDEMEGMKRIAGTLESSAKSKHEEAEKLMHEASGELKGARELREAVDRGYYISATPRPTS